MNEQSSFNLFNNQISGFSLSTDGNLLVVSDSEKYINVLQAGDKSMYAKDFNWHNNKVYETVWRREDSLLSVSLDCSAIIWDVHEKKMTKKITGLDRETLQACCYDISEDKFYVSGFDGGIIELIE